MPSPDKTELERPSLEKIVFCKEIHSFPVEDDLLLFDPRTSQLFRLNETAAFIWKGLGLGCTRDDLVHTLSTSTGRPVEALQRDMDGLLQQWQTLGLFGSKKTGIKDEDRDRPSFSSFQLDKNEIIRNDAADGPHITLHIIDTRVRMHVPSHEELSMVEPVVSHLVIDDQTEFDVKLHLVQTDWRYVLLKDGMPADWCQNKEGIAPMIHANTAMIAYDHASCFLGLHAAAVCYQEKGILIPAVSGSGKSTFTAALIADIFEYCADDLVLLSEPPIRMRAVPIAIGLKTGSWKPIEPFQPGVRSLTTHLRIDGKQVRYLTPPRQVSQKTGSRSLPIDIIVFPQYMPESREATLTSLSPCEGLCCLADAGYDVHGKLDVKKIEQFIDWIVNIPVYRLGFSHLDEALAVMKALANA